ncbi:hypothetical protein E2562_008251 [Oryza meyeriana var. granulata]|uniref:Uncharacterized protein n=1 Tax=Oryza meyeriana var. granulata TaxID=110450 RepID=A0A6G1DEW7_9ORYZ|nr:hypothetical protein E2562_008251 [Oryza meyeriana var. granulata]
MAADGGSVLSAARPIEVFGAGSVPHGGGLGWQTPPSSPGHMAWATMASRRLLLDLTFPGQIGSSTDAGSFVDANNSGGLTVAAGSYCRSHAGPGCIAVQAAVTLSMGMIEQSI